MQPSPFGITHIGFAVGATFLSVWLAGVEGEVYAALLSQSYHGVPAFRMVVKDAAVAMPHCEVLRVTG